MPVTFQLFDNIIRLFIFENPEIIWLLFISKIFAKLNLIILMSGSSFQMMPVYQKSVIQTSVQLKCLINWL